MTLSDPTSRTNVLLSAPEVLIVDDSPVVTLALSRILRDEGYEPAVCHTGEEALAYVRSHRPAAAVLDIHLPDLSGLVLSAKIRERLGDGPPIIILSGDASMENLRSLAHVGATYFISKPFNTEHLLEKLGEFCAG
jgi:DNA-binding response OmpR family regulator